MLNVEFVAIAPDTALFSISKYDLFLYLGEKKHILGVIRSSVVWRTTIYVF